MATSTLSLSPSPATTLASSSSTRRMTSTHFMFSRVSSLSQPKPKPKPNLHLLRHHLPLNITLHAKTSPKCTLAQFSSPPISSPAPVLESELQSSVQTGRILLWVLVLTGFCCLLLLLECENAVAATAAAAEDSIRASRIGLKIAGGLRRTGWADEAIVFALATLPVLELRGAIPVGYWMQLNPLVLTTLAILGNTLPVPFIVLYLKRLVSFLSRKNTTASRFLDVLLKRARDKAGPVQEFQWLGLMLFVAVPFPGTGAWTGAIIASVLDMPFWPAVSANFFGVILAGLLVNLLVSLGLKYAIATGVLLFFMSTALWNVLRHLKKTMSSK